MGSSKKISKEFAKNMTFEVLKWKKTHVTDINVVIKIKLNLSCICMLKYVFPIIVWCCSCRIKHLSIHTYKPLERIRKYPAFYFLKKVILYISLVLSSIACYWASTHYLHCVHCYHLPSIINFSFEHLAQNVHAISM